MRFSGQPDVWIFHIDRRQFRSSIQFDGLTGVIFGSSSVFPLFRPAWADYININDVFYKIVIRNIALSWHRFGASPFDAPRELVGKVGVEPTRSIEHMILSHACLPIPALPQAGKIIR